MKRTFPLLVALVAFAGVVMTTRPVGAADYPRGYLSATPHMPGWDWQRIYPYSPYNYGRNPYNPYVVYYPNPYIPPYGYPPYLPGYVPSTNQVSVTNLPVYRALQEPTVSGPLASPPPGTALIRLHAPSEWARVQFDGETTSTLGINRTFVTPELASGKTYRYEMVVTWTKDGKPQRAERTVRVQAGQIVSIDLGKPASSRVVRTKGD